MHNAIKENKVSWSEIINASFSLLCVLSIYLYYNVQEQMFIFRLVLMSSSKKCRWADDMTVLQLGILITIIIMWFSSLFKLGHHQTIYFLLGYRSIYILKIYVHNIMYCAVTKVNIECYIDRRACIINTCVHFIVIAFCCKIDCLLR